MAADRDKQTEQPNSQNSSRSMLSKPSIVDPLARSKFQDPQLITKETNTRHVQMRMFYLFEKDGEQKIEIMANQFNLSASDKAIVMAKKNEALNLFKAEIAKIREEKQNYQPATEAELNAWHSYVYGDKLSEDLSKIFEKYFQPFLKFCVDVNSKNKEQSMEAKIKKIEEYHLNDDLLKNLLMEQAQKENKISLVEKLDQAIKIYKRCQELNVSSESHLTTIQKEAMAVIKNITAAKDDIQAELNIKLREQRRFIQPKFIPGQHRPTLSRLPQAENVTSRSENVTALRNARAQANWRNLANKGIALKRGKIISLAKGKKEEDEIDQIRVLSSAELEEHRAVIRGNGVFYKLQDGGRALKELDTNETQSISHRKKGYMAYILNDEGEFMLFQHFDSLDKIAHSSVAEGRNVIAAGEIKIENGVLKEVTSHSGHYKPNEGNVFNMLDLCKRQGVDLSQVQLKLKDPLDPKYGLIGIECRDEFNNRFYAYDANLFYDVFKDYPEKLRIADFYNRINMLKERSEILGNQDSNLSQKFEILRDKVKEIELIHHSTSEQTHSTQPLIAHSIQLLESEVEQELRKIQKALLLRLINKVASLDGRFTQNHFKNDLDSMVAEVNKIKEKSQGFSEECLRAEDKIFQIEANIQAKRRVKSYKTRIDNIEKNCQNFGIRKSDLPIPIEDLRSKVGAIEKAPHSIPLQIELEQHLGSLDKIIFLQLINNFKILDDKYNHNQFESELNSIITEVNNLNPRSVNFLKDSARVEARLMDYGDKLYALEDNSLKPKI